MEHNSYFMKAYCLVGDMLEYCFCIESSRRLKPSEQKVLQFLLGGPKQLVLHTSSQLIAGEILEIGPQLRFDPPFTSNALSALNACGINCISRIIRTTRHLVLDENQKGILLSSVDPMTEMVYLTGLNSFPYREKNNEVRIVNFIGISFDEVKKFFYSQGMKDEDEIHYWYDYFINSENRDPTELEIFKITQGNTEHSKHPFLSSRFVIDGNEMPYTLFEIIKGPWKRNKGHSTVAFQDNASAVNGYTTFYLFPEDPTRVSPYVEEIVNWDITFKAETHNFPTGVSPFPGAATGAGGRMRDNKAIGRGGLTGIGTSGIAVAGLLFENYDIPGERKGLVYPQSLARARGIVIWGSDGLTQYHNEHGEPCINGFCHSFDMVLPSGERLAYLKPVLFTGGMGMMASIHRDKKPITAGMLIIQIGGPAYRIGMGGGSASSEIQKDSNIARDINAVQRGNPEMANRTHRVITGCINLLKDNLIHIIHDQGAAGVFNVISELIENTGGVIDVRKINLGDPTMTPLEILGAEYQERLAMVIDPNALELLTQLCKRERVPLEVLGTVTDTHRFQVYDSLQEKMLVDMPLDKLDSKLKTIEVTTVPRILEPVTLPEDLTLRKSIEYVSKQFGVASKGWLLHKADRSVGGKVVLQQCVGPMHIPIANAAVMRLGFSDYFGSACATGTKPNMIAIDPERGARLLVAEAILNLVVSVKVKNFEHITLYMNEMCAAKLPGQGARIYRMVSAACDEIEAMGLTVNGGKDSLSMAVDVNGEIVKSPDTLVLTAYAPVPDIRKIMTPYIKKPGKSQLLYVSFHHTVKRLGGSALLQSFDALDNECPDVDDTPQFVRLCLAIQELIDKGLILAAHDTVGDGFYQALNEMCMASNCGADIHLRDNIEGNTWLSYHAEEIGVIFEYEKFNYDEIRLLLERATLRCERIGDTIVEPIIKYAFNGQMLDEISTFQLRQWWESTSKEIKLHQQNPECVNEEFKGLENVKVRQYVVPFRIEEVPAYRMSFATKPKVVILRDEGSNSESETAYMFRSRGFDCWDVTMTDLINEVNGGSLDSLNEFVGVIPVGGFSCADVFGSGMAWAGSILFHPKVKKMFSDFRKRSDTFGLGICNGFQMMSQLGWLGEIYLDHNRSEKFESRLSRIRIGESNSFLLKGMEGAELPIWTSHGEGNLKFRKGFEGQTKYVEAKRLPIQFIDDYGNITEQYPFNPNGSSNGNCAITSEDGRFMGIMPHPERNMFPEQEPWKEGYPEHLLYGPLLKIVDNAYEWWEEMQKN